MDKARFFTFEGMDGVGKSTVIVGLESWLSQSGLSVMVTHEPYDLETLDQSDPVSWASDRSRHIRSVINPAMGSYQYILCDRYVHSSYAYQYQSDIVRELNSGFPKPDRVYLLDCDPTTAIARMSDRGDTGLVSPTLFDDLSGLRSRYLDLAAAEPDLITVIDASKSPALVLQDIIDDVVGGNRDD